MGFGMDETLDPDIEARAFALEAAMWFYDVTGSAPDNVGDVTNLSEVFLHYLTNGQSNEFDPKSAPACTVRGGI